MHVRIRDCQTDKRKTYTKHPPIKLLRLHQIEDNEMAMWMSESSSSCRSHILSYKYQNHISSPGFLLVKAEVYTIHQNRHIHIIIFNNLHSTHHRFCSSSTEPYKWFVPRQTVNIDYAAVPSEGRIVNSMFA